MMPESEKKHKFKKAQFFFLPLLVGTISLFSAWMLLVEAPFDEDMLFFITILAAIGLICLTTSVWINTGNEIIEKYIDTGIGAAILFGSIILFQGAQDIPISGDSSSELEVLEILLRVFCAIGAVIIVIKVISLILMKKADPKE